MSITNRESLERSRRQLSKHVSFGIGIVLGAEDPSFENRFRGMLSCVTYGVVVLLSANPTPTVPHRKQHILSSMKTSNTTAQRDRSNRSVKQGKEERLVLTRNQDREYTRAGAAQPRCLTVGSILHQMGRKHILARPSHGIRVVS